MVSVRLVGIESTISPVKVAKQLPSMQVPLQYLPQPPQCLCSLPTLKQPPSQMSGSSGGHFHTSIQATDADEVPAPDICFTGVCVVFGSRIVRWTETPKDVDGPNGLQT